MATTETKPVQALEPRDMTPEAVRGRIALFCGWFEVEPVAIKTHACKVRLTDNLLAWSAAHGANLDWQLTGKIQPVATAFRATEAPGPLHLMLDQLEPHQHAVLSAVLRRVRAGETTFEVAMAAFGALCDRLPANHGAAA